MLQIDKQIIGIILPYKLNKVLKIVFNYGKHSLKAYPKSNITFNLLPHVKLEEEHKCIIDNLWISFNQVFNNQINKNLDNKNLDRKYFITCLNSLSEYFHKRIMVVQILTSMLFTKVIE